MFRPIIIVQGAQYGSEAKGMVAHALCQRERVDWTVRTGSINAGHTIVLNGEKVAFQQLPTGAVLDGVKVVIGPGAYVNPSTLRGECALANCVKRLYIDSNCGVHLDYYTEEAATAARNVKIGATGKGCAEAIVHKIKDRGVGVPLLLRERMDDLGLTEPVWRSRLFDTAELLIHAYYGGERILIEGTQGTLLDFHTGPYPFVTSRQTTAAAWVAEAGLPPSLDYEIVLVVRTYPIRVAGNSGPMSKETTWPDLARHINQRLKRRGYPPLVEEESLRLFEMKLKLELDAALLRKDPPGEYKLCAATNALKSMDLRSRDELMKLFETTTVTKRLRRIAELDLGQLRTTVTKENPAYLVVTFLNYVFPELVHERELNKEALAYLERVQEAAGCWVRYYTIGPKSEDLMETPISFRQLLTH